MTFSVAMETSGGSVTMTTPLDTRVDWSPASLKQRTTLKAVSPWLTEVPRVMAAEERDDVFVNGCTSCDPGLLPVTAMVGAGPVAVRYE